MSPNSADFSLIADMSSSPTLLKCDLLLQHQTTICEEPSKYNGIQFAYRRANIRGSCLCVFFLDVEAYFLVSKDIHMVTS